MPWVGDVSKNQPLTWHIYIIGSTTLCSASLHRHGASGISDWPYPCTFPFGGSENWNDVQNNDDLCHIQEGTVSSSPWVFATLISAVYRRISLGSFLKYYTPSQVLSLSQVTVGEISIGHIVNLASNDVQRFDLVWMRHNNNMQLYFLLDFRALFLSQHFSLALCWPSL